MAGCGHRAVAPQTPAHSRARLIVADHAVQAGAQTQLGIEFVTEPASCRAHHVRGRVALARRVSNKLYTKTGRPSIAPEKLLRALLLQGRYCERELARATFVPFVAAKRIHDRLRKS